MTRFEAPCRSLAARSHSPATRSAPDSVASRRASDAAADGVTPAMFDDDEPLEKLRGILWRELGPDGQSLPARRYPSLR